MVVVSPIRDHLPDAEELTKFAEDLDALRALRHRELVCNLVTELVADSTRPILLPDKADGEASFSSTKPITQPRNSISLSCWFAAPDTLSPW
jgi:hypothetical protein